MESNGHTPNIIKVNRKFTAFSAFYCRNCLALKKITDD